MINFVISYMSLLLYSFYPLLSLLPRRIATQFGHFEMSFSPPPQTESCNFCSNTFLSSYKDTVVHQLLKSHLGGRSL